MTTNRSNGRINGRGQGGAGSPARDGSSPARWIRLAMALIPALSAAAAAGIAGDLNRTLVSQLAPGERHRLESLAALSPSFLESLEALAAPSEVEVRTRALLEVDTLFIGHRSTDEEGRARIHHHLEAVARELEPYGVEHLGVLRAEATVPVELDRRVDPADREPPSRIEAGGQSWRIHPVWPNGAMPSLAPAEGLSGPLIDTGHASWEAIEGLPLDGAIALMDFAGGRNFERLFAHGVRAVIVLESPSMSRHQAENLFFNTPAAFPRFYAEAAEARELRALAATPGTRVTVHGGAIYENRIVETHFLYLPPSPERTFQLKEGDLLELIAAHYGLRSRELIDANQLESPVLRPGQQLLIPGRGATHTVRAGEWADRLAAFHGLDPRRLLEHNGLGAEELEPGVELRIPVAEEPITFFIPIDSVSTVPGVAHGAKVAGNLTAGLMLLEHFARSPFLHRSKGILFVFTDGDSVGGLASRTFGEYAMLRDGTFASRAQPAAMGVSLERLREAEAWFEGGAAPEAAARWLVEEWLHVRLEDVRVALAEERIEHLVKLPTLEPSSAAHAATAAVVADLDNRLAELLALRRRSVLDRSLGQAQRLERLAAELARPETAARFGPLGLDRSTLAVRFRAELEEVRRREAYHRNNLEVVATVLDRLQGAGGGIRLGWAIDLSSGSPHLGITEGNASQFRVPYPVASGPLVRAIGTRFRSVLALAAERAGWPEERAFVTDEDRRDFPVLPHFAPAAYPEFWTLGNLAVLPLGTLNDRLELLDTPHDVPDRFDFTNLALQIRGLLVLAALQVESPLDSPAPSRLTRRRFGTLEGRTLQFNLRSGIDAQDPVPGAIVYYPATKAWEGEISAHNSMVYRGVRKGLVRIAGLDGRYRIPLEAVDLPSWRYSVFAYGLNREKALFDHVHTFGQVGTAKQSPVFRLLDSRVAEKNLVMAELHPLALVTGPDPADYSTIGGGQYAEQNYQVVDAVLRGEPRHYALDNPRLHYGEHQPQTTILYLPEGSRGSLLFQSGGRYRLMLVGEMDAGGRGRGWRIGPLPDGDPNRVLRLAPLAIARQMQALAEHRRDEFARFGIASETVDAALRRSAEQAALATEAAAEHRWREAEGAAREAWGILLRTYPRVLQMGREAVFSVILLMALLVPAAFFLERLLVGARHIVARLAGTAGFFALGVLFLNTFHPAFQIAISPVIVVVAFIMILMSVIVLVLAYGRFETLLRRARIEGGEIESEEIALASSLATALSLGVSNLRKRPSRTFLTTLTVTVLTFSIVAFVSVSGSDAIAKRSVELDTEVDGRTIVPEPPVYDGVLFRAFYWQSLSEAFLSAIASEFGSRHETAVRAHYIEVEGGNNADREGVNQIEIRRGAATTIVTGLMAFEPAETRFTGLHRAVGGEQWFRARDPDTGREADRFTVILPETAAHDLGITGDEILDADGNRRPEDELPRVSMMGQSWRVIGILDTERADRIRDVNGRSPAMVDYLRSAMTPGATGDLINEPTMAYHLSWRELALVPWEARRDVGARPRSVAVKFAPGDDGAAFFEGIALRLNQPVFAHVGGELSFVTTRVQRTVGGLAMIIVPVLLCILIVLNTMLGTVEERRGEVGMLGAIGLSPNQISFLLLSESTVYSVLGIVLGIFGGLFFANAINWLAAAGIPVFSTLSFNFTSVTAMALALATGGVVLLATLIPARKAAALAAPSGMARWVLPPPAEDRTIVFDLPFTLTRGNALGMVVFFRQFLSNHLESTSADFNCRQIRAGLAVDPENRPALELSASIWLTPYDLDVAQEFRMQVQASGTEGVFAVRIILRRVSGAEEAWLRTNYGFLDLVRRQFLFWRNLPPERREAYLKEGRRLLETTASHA
ncbi:MAG: LysM peptidoglycan-binding domain-containing protein [Puniceicoccaceae bacterium]|nr:MAG: LysM peptidoglycan-binding domain-containing protein [Puniceicoccaceae bacterium]